MPTKPSVGLILLRAEWFDRVVALPELKEGMRLDAAQIDRQLSQDLSLDFIWIVGSADALDRAVQEISAAHVDLFVLAFQVWAEDVYLQPLSLAIAGRPLAVWCYLPWQHPPRPMPFSGVLRGSGPVGTLEGLGTLRNLSVDYLFTWGPPESPRTRRDLLSFARAGRAWHALRRARIGLLPMHNEQMQSTFVDEIRLQTDIGPTVIPLSVADLKRAAEALPQHEVDAFVGELRAGFRIDGVNDETLTWAGRCSLGLAQLAIDSRVDLISLQDTSDELHALLGLRPCLRPRMLDETGILTGLEGDLGAAVAMMAQKRFSDAPLFFAEIWYWDEAENTVVCGHAGPQDPNVALPGKAWISPDFEYAQTDAYPGAHMQFVARPGPVTLLQVRGTPSGWQAIAVGGEAIESQPWLEGYPHAVIRLAAPLDTLLTHVARVGSTQHWIMTYGDTVPQIRALCALLKIPLEEISP
jgi:L-fucose isomerase-like protein